LPKKKGIEETVREYERAGVGIFETVKTKAEGEVFGKVGRIVAGILVGLAVSIPVTLIAVKSTETGIAKAQQSHCQQLGCIGIFGGRGTANRQSKDWLKSPASVRGKTYHSSSTRQTYTFENAWKNSDWFGPDVYDREGSARTWFEGNIAESNTKCAGC
jgi:hypothetical protein